MVTCTFTNTLIPPVVLPSALVGDTVFIDTNGNGVQDSGEPGIAGVTIVLTGPSGTLTTVTDSDGKYVFAALEPGTYSVVIDLTTLPAGLGATTPTSFTVALVGGSTFLDADFGFRAPVTLPKTGADSDRIAWMAALMLALGALLITATKRRYREGFVGAETMPLVSVTSATEEELRQVPGVGRSLASRIVAKQDELTTIDDLLGLPGVGKATLAKLRRYLTD